MTTFQQYGTTPLLLPAGSTPEAATCGFVSTASAVPASLSLGETFGEDGTLVFFSDLTTAGTAAFVASAVCLLQSIASLSPKLVWFPTTVTRTGPLSGSWMGAMPSGGALVTTALTQIAIGDIALKVPGGVTISADQHTLTFTPPADHPCALYAKPTGAGRPVQVALGAPVAIPVLTGSGTDGCFTAPLLLDTRMQDALDLGLHLFVETAFGTLMPASFRIFDLSPTAPERVLSTALTLDVLQPANHARSQLALAPTQPAMLSQYTNAFGQQLAITPVAGTAVAWPYFVFEPRPLTPPPRATAMPPPPSAYVIAPVGSYTLSLSIQGTPGSYTSSLMPGLSASEYFLLDTETTTISFTPGQPACATFAQVPSGGASKPSFAPLTDWGRTSYATIDGAAAAIAYFAQPAGAVLHALPAEASASDETMTYLPLQAGQATGTGTAFPLLPYAGLKLLPGLTSEIAGAVEAQSVARSRRRQIAVPSTPPTPAASNAITPQGLFLSMDGASWDTLTLTEPGPDEGPPLKIRSISATLQAALQSDPLFLVISNPSVFTSTTSPLATYAYELTIEAVNALVSRKAIPQSAATALGAPLTGIVGTTFDSLTSFVAALPACFTAEATTYQSALATAAGPAGGSHELTAAAVQALVTADTIPASIGTLLQPIVGTKYTSLAAFTAAVQALFTAQAAGYQPVLSTAAARFFLDIAGWTFNLSAEVWKRHGTLLMFKFVRQPLSSLALSLSSWAAATAMNANPQATQQALATFVDQTAAGAQNDPDLADFKANVLDDPNWTGVLAINVDIPLTALPAQIESLAAGIDPSRFFAHHVGINITPSNVSTAGGGARIALHQSSLFGLINYQDPTQLTSSATYDFKVLSLKAVFAQSALVGFSSQVDLLANEFFGETFYAEAGSSTAVGNNLLFDGIWQKTGGVGSYVFSLAAPQTFTPADTGHSAFQNIEVATGRFVTLTPTAAQAAANQVHAQFLLDGTVAFKVLPVDLLSFGPATATAGGGLSFTSLSVDMAFNSAIPNYKMLDFDITESVLHPAASALRPSSLVAHFPVKLVAFASGDAGTSPIPAGYLPVNVAFQAGGLSGSWYGLSFELNLGTLGALTGHSGFLGTLLIAWSPPSAASADAGGPSVFMGVGMPGVHSGSLSIPIEGILKLDFGHINLLGSGTDYILEIANIALEALSLKFPPTGQTSLLLFGNPANGGGDVVGWYAAYSNLPS